MKKILMALSCISMILFTACGGGGGDTPPPLPPGATPSASNQQALSDLSTQANRAKASCSSSASSTFLPYALALQSGGAAPGQMPPPLPPPSSDCKNDYMNMLMAFSTLQFKTAQGQVVYANSQIGQQWFAGQIGGLLNQVGQSLAAQGVQLTPQMVQNLYGVAMNYANTNIVPGLPANLQGNALAGLNGYANTGGAAGFPGATGIQAPIIPAGSPYNSYASVASPTTNLFNSGGYGSGFGTIANTSPGSANLFGGTTALGTPLTTTPSYPNLLGYGMTSSANRGIASTPATAKAYKGNPGTFGGFVPVH